MSATARGRPAPALLGAVVAAFALGLAVIVVGTVGAYDREASGDRSATGALSDYRDALYQPVRALAGGSNPYDYERYLATMAVDQELPPYFPINYLPFAPLSALDLPVAAGLFVVLSVVVVLATGALVAVTAGLGAGGAHRRSPIRWSWPVALVAMGYAAVVMTSRGGFQALQYGQSGPWVALCLAAGVLGARRHRPGLVALAVAAAWAKPSVGLPVAVLLAVAGGHHRWLRPAVLWGTVAAWATWLPVGLLLLRTDGPVQLVRIMLEDLEYSAGHPFGLLRSPSRLDATSVLAKLVGADPPPSLELLIGLVVLGVTAWAARRCSDPAHLFAVVVLGTLVALWRQPYDLVLALPAVSVIVMERWRQTGGPAGTSWRDPVVLLAAGLAAALFSWPFGHRGGELLGLGDTGTVRLSMLTGTAALLAWAASVVLARRSPVAAATAGTAGTAGTAEASPERRRRAPAGGAGVS